MLKIDYYDSHKEAPIYLALGFFDSVHLGHRFIIESCTQRARLAGGKSAVLTFRNNPHKNLKRNTELIYTYEERLELLRDTGADIVISAFFDDEYMQTTAENFLSHLHNNFNIAFIACGKDYRFGHFGKGDVALLREFCAQKNIEFAIAEDYIYKGEKVSTTRVRDYLLSGDTAMANKLLFRRYFVQGDVIHGSSLGKRLLFPTANIDVSSQKLRIKDGVYVTCSVHNGKKYLGVTNCGNKPTFNESSYTIESHLLDFKGNLYGKKLKIEFIDRLRDVKKFSGIDELRQQIERDIAKAREYSKVTCKAY